MRAGTFKKPKYLPIHMICEHLKKKIPEVNTILSFHAITGCDTVSYSAGHSKKMLRKTFTCAARARKPRAAKKPRK